MLPRVSAFQPLMSEKSPVMASSMMNLRPLNSRTSRGFEAIATEPSVLYLIGKPPSYDTAHNTQHTRHTTRHDTVRPQYDTTDK